MFEATKNWLRNPPGWVMLVLTLVIAVFAITGPVSPQLLNRVPAVIRSLLAFVLNHRNLVAIVLFALLFLWMRRPIRRALIWGREWLYVRPLAFLIRPAVQRVVQSPAIASESEPLPGWKIIDNWEVREEQVGDWELGPDWVRGNQKGTVLWREHLPAVCEVRFEACLLQSNGGDEIDVLVGDSMALYYAEGVRLDYMTSEHDHIDFKRDSHKKLVPWEKPQVGKWYAFTVIKTSEKATLIIDGKWVMDITWGPRTIFEGRLGFHHWNNKVEFKNLCVGKTQ
jgi:hypothetical protein